MDKSHPYQHDDLHTFKLRFDMATGNRVDNFAKSISEKLNNPQSFISREEDLWASGGSYKLAQ